MAPPGGDAPDAIGQRPAGRNADCGHENEAVHAVRRIESDLRREVGAHRVSDDVRPREADGIHPPLDPFARGVEREITMPMPQASEAWKVEQEDPMSARQ